MGQQTRSGILYKVPLRFPGTASRAADVMRNPIQSAFQILRCSQIIDNKQLDTYTKSSSYRLGFSKCYFGKKLRKKLVCAKINAVYSLNSNQLCKHLQNDLGFSDLRTCRQILTKVEQDKRIHNQTHKCNV